MIALVCHLLLLASSSAAASTLPSVAPAAQELSQKRAVITVERVWDRAAHNAFTDILHVGGAIYLTFREGSGHTPGLDGTIRVLRSDDHGHTWRSVALLAEEGVDLRDPKLSVTPRGRLMLTLGGSMYEGSAVIKREPRVAFSPPSGEGFGEPVPARIDPSIATNDDWLWRVTWHRDVGYGAVYAFDEEAWTLHLVKTRDGMAYENITRLELEDKPNETTLRFLSDGTMLALVRREGGTRTAQLGRSTPPYESWQFEDLGVPIGGPNLLVLSDEEYVIAGREYTPTSSRTSLGVLRAGEPFAFGLELPSAGDTSYPGLLVLQDELWVSYYSGHQGQVGVYLARLRLPVLRAE